MDQIIVCVRDYLFVVNLTTYFVISVLTLLPVLITPIKYRRLSLIIHWGIFFNLLLFLYMGISLHHSKVVAEGEEIFLSYIYLLPYLLANGALFAAVLLFSSVLCFYWVLIFLAKIYFASSNERARLANYYTFMSIVVCVLWLVTTFLFFIVTLI